MAETIKIPLFPLGLVLLPGMQLPLHIFEARYRQMISECVAEMVPFGIVLFDGQAIHAVGCMARITEVLKAYDDGRMDIMTHGENRFVIRKLIQEKPYMEAEVIFFDDNLETEDDDTTTIVQQAAALIDEASAGDAGLSASTVSADMDPKDLSFAIAAIEGVSPAERQGLLEMVSPSERLKKCVQALSRIIERNRLTLEIKKTIGGNGTPPKSILKELGSYLEE